MTDIAGKILFLQKRRRAMAEQYISMRSRVSVPVNCPRSMEAVISQLSAAATEEDCMRILSEKRWGHPESSSEEMFQE